VILTKGQARISLPVLTGMGYWVEVPA